MGGMGEQIGSAGNFSVILWCDLTRDVSKFYFSFYENDEFFDPDEKKITSRLIDALRNGEWLDCFGNKSRETDQGFVILDHQEYSISIQVDLCGERASLEVVLIKDGRIVERQDPFDRIESKHYSPFYNVIMERNNLAREMKNEINALTEKLQSWANQNGYRFTDHAPSIIESLTRQKKKHGDHYCPCRTAKVKENICPCVHVHSDIEKKGHCHCLLFEKDD